MKTLTKIMLILLATNLISACSTMTRDRNISLIQQLNNYKGLTTTEIQQRIKRDNLGIQLKKPPKISEQQLIYTFERSVSTAMSSQLPIPDARGRFIPTQMGGSTEAYSSQMSCHIIFNFKEQRAESIQLKGRAC